MDKTVKLFLHLVINNCKQKGCSAFDTISAHKKLETGKSPGFFFYKPLKKESLLFNITKFTAVAELPPFYC